MLWSDDDPMAARVYRNAVENLSDKIVIDNVRIREHLTERPKVGKELRGLRKKLEAAVALLIKKPAWQLKRPRG